MSKPLNHSFAATLDSVIYPDPEGTGIWVAWCPAIDTYSQGETEGQAREAIEEAARLFLESSADIAKRRKKT